ncbi:MAG: UDP-forming cellulose synthase catalytic subunit [Acidobacteria bacterium]|nr:UDP-forming cellulose synthase catalytic subunit [Acidobacteriota bacterium]
MSRQRFKIEISHWLPGVALLIVLFLPLVYSAIVVPLSPREQALVSLALIAFAMLASLFRVMRPLIIFLSCFASMRYFYWRISSTLNLDSEFDALISVLLLSAECYGLLILFLGYFQTIEVLKRELPPLNAYPSVDVFIPTYNEPIDIVRRTVIGAMAICYPNKKVYVLDDGHRSEIQTMAENLGAHYLTRPDNRHAKAGNLNQALGQTDSELLAIFDADHVPVRGFLQKTVGFFENDDVALVQTAQHFFNPDPYERNLHLAGKVAPEQSFFYHVIQPGNDFWNAAFFCGSCAVLRRSAIESIGGFKTQTVTEDAHTALELHSRGYQSIYLPLPLAAGLATETFAAHVKQRMRWARGMAQILRIDCPLFKRGLSLPQRLNYFNAMLHFFFGVPRLIMILAPLTFLLLGAHPIKADALAVIAYILPHIGLSTIANSLISKSFRQSFWAGVYEVSIAPYTAGVTLLALISPKMGKFNVTDKGTQLSTARFDFQTGWVSLALIALSLLGLMIAFPARLLWFWSHGAESSELHSILINTPWALANLLTLIAAACVAYEQPQQRQAPRIARDFTCELDFGDSHLPCRTVDISENGVSVQMEKPLAIPVECFLSFSAQHPEGSSAALRVRVRLVRCDWSQSGGMFAAFTFAGLDPMLHQGLVRLIFSDDESWTRHSYPRDRLFHSFWHLASTFWRVTKPRQAHSRQAPRLEGKWNAWYQGQSCQCRILSGAGAAVEFSEPPREPKSQGPFRLELHSDTFVHAPVAECRPDARSPLGFVLQFHWAEFREYAAFWQAIYATSTPVQTRTTRTPVSRWIAGLRQTAS